MRFYSLLLCHITSNLFYIDIHQQWQTVLQATIGQRALILGDKRLDHRVQAVAQHVHLIAPYECRPQFAHEVWKEADAEDDTHAGHSLACAGAHVFVLITVAEYKTETKSCLGAPTLSAQDVAMMRVMRGSCCARVLTGSNLRTCPQSHVISVTTG
jgi:hypothetical protein